MHFGTRYGLINNYRIFVNMVAHRIIVFLVTSILFFSSSTFSAEEAIESSLPTADPLVGSWSFSGMVANESGEQYGYFFQVHRQDNNFQVKTALIDGQTNQLKLSYEYNSMIDNALPLNWHIGQAFMRFNPINDSWVFGVKLENAKGFNFKVDMLQQANQNDKSLALRPGVQLQALQTSRLNGHIKIEKDTKEQFVTGNNAWFGKVWFSEKQDATHEISTAFCRLNNDNGFYSANLKESDATGAAIAGWRDSLGNKVKMSQFISIKNEPDDQCLLHVALPKLQLNVINTLKNEETAPHFIAGFSKDNKGFCFVADQKFAALAESSLVQTTA